MDLRTSSPLSVILAAVLTGCLAIGSAPSASATTAIHFTFFLHDNLLTFSNDSAFPITLPVLTAPSGSYLGALVVFDDSMTTTPDPNSLQIGRGRGLYLFDANDNSGAAIQFTWTAQFNVASGYGNGTTLSFAGFDRTTDPTREISITGGTGLFRYAKGYAIISTSSAFLAAAVLNITAYVTYGL